jgi:hypothetical protein
VPAVENLAAFRLLTGDQAPSEAERLSTVSQRIAGVSANIDEAGQSHYLTLDQVGDGQAFRATIQMARVSAATPTAVRYPDSDLALRFRLIPQIIAANLGPRVFIVSQPGYDTHAVEFSPVEYSRLMTELSMAVGAFYADTAAQGRANQVLALLALGAIEQAPVSAVHSPWHDSLAGQEAHRVQRGGGEEQCRDSLAAPLHLVGISYGLLPRKCRDG